MLSRFASGSTLCWALPALLVALGAGAALSSPVTVLPQLVWFSEQKALVFGVAGVMLALSGALQWRAQSALPAGSGLGGGLHQHPAYLAACVPGVSWRVSGARVSAFVSPLLM